MLSSISNIASLATQGANSSQSINLSALDDLSSGASDSTYIDSIQSAISKMGQTSTDMQKYLVENVNTSQPIDPMNIMQLQSYTTKISIENTVWSKSINFGIKFVNELTHLQ